MKKILLSFLIIILSFSIYGCGEKKQEPNNQSQTETNKNQDSQNPTIIDDEIIEWTEEDNKEEGPKTVESTLINCENCVFAFFKDKKTFGSKVDEYTKDYSSLKNENGYQRRRFLGLVLDGNNKIKKAYACGIEKGKAYCLEGKTDDSAFSYNVGILNKVFSSNECSYNSNSTRYTCIGQTNGDTRKDGYVSVHYDKNCHIFGQTGEIYCN